MDEREVRLLMEEHERSGRHPKTVEALTELLAVKVANRKGKERAGLKLNALKNSVRELGLLVAGEDVWPA